ncbi:MAG: hypothetical protein RDV48_17515 [Candidatus Eremiobacteraeota bacterium]|nr:hypothetical protein [Candidatus Eremiobacteraeota bacterium]
MTVKSFPRNLAALALIIAAFLSLVGPSFAFTEKPDWNEVYIVGIIEPYNRTEIAGRLELAPLFVERMEKLLTDANYKVVRITNEMLYRDDFRVYHETEPDTPLDTEQIVRLSKQYKLDALVTGNILSYQKRSKAEFFHLKEFWKVSLEGLVYSGKTGSPLLRVPVNKEERIYLDSQSPPWQKQILDIDVAAVTECAGSFLAAMGRKPQDREAPLIDIRKPQDAQVLRSTVVLLLGEVTDSSPITFLSVNGEEKELFPKKNLKLYYPVTYMYGKEKEHATLTVVAKDMYGNTSSRTIGLTWGKPVRGEITKVQGKDILINVGSRQGVSGGMLFMACNVETYRDPATGLLMFNFVEVGPIYVTKVYTNRSECTFIHPEKAERMKKGDMVR